MPDDARASYCATLGVWTTTHQRQATLCLDVHVSRLGEAGANTLGQHEKRSADIPALKATLNAIPDNEPMDANDGLRSNDYKDRTRELDAMDLINTLGEDEKAYYMDGSFKMKHTKGRQPTQFCQLVFDRIDQILYRPRKDYTIKTLNQSASIAGFARHDIQDLQLLAIVPEGVLNTTESTRIITKHIDCTPILLCRPQV
jgi:hypothetical protein